MKLEKCAQKQLLFKRIAAKKRMFQAYRQFANKVKEPIESGIVSVVQTAPLVWGPAIVLLATDNHV